MIKSIDSLSIQLGLLSAFIFLIIFVSLRKYWKNKLISKIKTTFPDEKILKTFENVPTITYFFPLISGGFLGAYILPFFCVDVYSTEIVYKRFLIIFIIFELILIIAIIFIFSSIDVMTSRRLYRLSFFLMFNKYVIKKLNVLYSDITSVHYEQFLDFEQLTVRTKDCYYQYFGYKNLKEIKKYIEELR